MTGLVRTSVVTWRNPSISLRLRVPPEWGGSLCTRTSIVPASMSSESRLFLREVGGGDGEGSGEETSEPEGSGVEDGEGRDTGRDFRGFLAGCGRVSFVSGFRFVAGLEDVTSGEEGVSLASGVISGGSITAVG